MTTKLFRTVPLDDLVVLWQGLGLDIVQSLLLQRPPAIFEFFNEDRMNLLAANDDYTARSYSQIVKDAVKGQTADTAQYIQGQIAQQTELTKSALPKNMWKMLALRAWTEPQFRQNIHNLIDHHLRHWVFMDVQPYSPIVLHPNTYFLLLGVVSSIVQRQAPRISKLQPNLVRYFRNMARIIGIAGRIKDEGANLGLSQAHWATVWDQWLLLEAYGQWNHKRWRQDYRSAIGHLPLRKYTAYPEPPRPASVMLASVDWDTNFPKWLGVWLQMGAVRIAIDTVNKEG